MVESRIGPGHRDVVREELENFLEKNSHLIKSVLEVGYRDISTSFKATFEKHKIKYTGINKDIHDLKFEDNSFDLIFGCHCFEHFINPIKALKETLRVLKPGKFCFYATPYPTDTQTLTGDFDHIFCLFPIQMKKLMMYVGFFSQISYLKMTCYGERLTEHGWNVISIGQKRKS